MTSLGRAVAALVVGVGALLGCAPPAFAQDDDVIGEVRVGFDVGEIDPAEGDWPIDAVEVSGELEEGEELTVELVDADGSVLWSATTGFDAPVTRIPVDQPVYVAEVASARVEQGIAVVGGVQIEPPEVEWKAGGGGGGGQLALSMVMAVMLVAIVFRTPLPSATTQRWTK